MTGHLFDLTASYSWSFLACGLASIFGAIATSLTAPLRLEHSRNPRLGRFQVAGVERPGPKTCRGDSTRR